MTVGTEKHHLGQQRLLCNLPLVMFPNNILFLKLSWTIWNQFVLLRTIIMCRLTIDQAWRLQDANCGR